MSSAQSKPTGVMVVSLVHLIIGVVWLFLGLYLVMIANDASRFPLGGQEIARYLLPIALLVLLIGAAYEATAWGLWNARDWARAAAITIAALTLVTEAASLLYALQVSSQFNLPVSYALGGGTVLLYAAVETAMIYYLLLPDTVAWFRGAGPGTGAIACFNCGLALQPEWVTCPHCGTRVSGSTDSTWGQGLGGPDPLPPTTYAEPSTRLAPPRAPALGWLVIRSGNGAGTKFDLFSDSDNLLGRDGGCQIRIEGDDYISRQHARLKFESGSFYIYDVGSSGGTYVNGQKVNRLMLYDGNRIRVGQTTLEFKRITPPR